MNRAVICTSSSGLDNIDISNNINLLRLRIHISGVEFIDGQNITREKLQEYMTLSNSGIHTSPAPHHDITKMLNQLYYDQGVSDVFIVTLSSALSESYDIIKQTADTFKDRMNIHVYDCKDLNMCEAMLAIEAEQMLDEGKSFEEIASRLDQIRNSHEMLFAVNDLSSLIKNKKLSATSGFFANLLSIKPVLTVTNEGNIIAVNKIRKIEKTFDHIISYFAPFAHKPDAITYVLAGGDENLTNHFVKKVKKELYLHDVPVFPISSISMANTGPGVVGLCVCKDYVPRALELYSQS